MTDNANLILGTLKNFQLNRRIIDFSLKLHDKLKRLKLNRPFWTMQKLLSRIHFL